MAGQNKRLLAFFETDLPARPTTYLSDQVRSGFSLLALDVGAANLAQGASLPYTTVDDWANDEVICQAKEKGALCEHNWFKVAYEKFSSDGICWPEFDRHAMFWFWQEVAFADLLLERFVEEKVVELHMFRNAHSRPGFHDGPADIFSSYWESAWGLQDTTLRVVAHRKAKRQFFVETLKRPLFRKGGEVLYRHLKPIAGNKDALLGKTVFAVFPWEAIRFNHIIQHFKQAGRSDSIAVLLISHEQQIAKELESKWGIPVFTKQKFRPNNKVLRKRFQSGFQETVDRSGGEVWGKALRYMGGHFRFFVDYHWPMLSSDYRFWVNLWSVMRPEAVMVSSLYKSESQLPALAANQANIHTFAIPHGAVQIPDNLISAHNILFDSGCQKIAWELSGIETERLIPCREVIRTEYAFSRTNLNPASKVTLLALTNPVSGCPHRLLPKSGCGFMEQIQALRALSRPPIEVQQRCRIMIKAHPGWPDLEIFSLVDPSLTDSLLPLEADLDEALDVANIVIAVNYIGSGLVHSLRRHKPVVLFWVDPLLGKTIPYRGFDMFLQAGELARSEKELWRIIRLFMEDTQYSEKMKQRAQRFSDAYLCDDHFPPLLEVIHTALGKNQ